MRPIPFSAAEAAEFHLWLDRLLAREHGDQLDLFSPAAVRKPLPPPEHEGNGLFEGGPPTGLQLRLGLTRPGRPRVLFRASLVAGLGWLPLLVLAGFQDVVLRDGSFLSFLTDYGAIGRSLAAAPVLILAERIAAPRLSAIALHFRDAGLVAARDAGRFRDAIRSTVRLRDSVMLEIAVCVATCVIAAIVSLSVSPGQLPSWHRVGAGSTLSLAGWWHGLVSVPLLFVLLLGWMWRLALWARFLWLMSRLDLHLVPAHPDGAAGLKFVGMSLQPLAVIAFALGAIIAGTVANRVAHDHVPLLAYRYAVVWLLGVAVALLAGPLLVFTTRLLDAWRQGVFEYGTLARSLGRQMEERWLRRSATPASLDANDFSATTDLYSVTANVYNMSIVPIGLKNLGVLAIGALLPFVPVVLMSVSPEILFQKLSRFLL